MANGDGIQSLERMLFAEHYEDAASMAWSLISADNTLYERVIELIERHAYRSPVLAYLTASAYAAGLVEAPDDMSAARLFAVATTIDDPETSLKAHLGLALEYVGEGEIIRAMQHLEIAADDGDPVANYHLGMIEASNVDDGLARLEDAVHHLETAYEGGLPQSRVPLATLLFNHVDEVSSQHDPARILAEAVDDGDEDAKEILGKLKDVLKAGPKLFERFISKDRGRPQAVLNAIINESGRPVFMAEAVTAALYGFETFGELQEAYSVAKRSSTPDERLDPLKAMKRHGAQLQVLLYHGFGEDVVEQTLSMLAPTKEAGKPSLRGMEEVYRAQSENMVHGVMDEMDDFLRDAGLPGIDALRTAFPIQAEAWLDCLQSQFGWSFMETFPDVVEDGSLIGFAFEDSVDPFSADVFLSNVMYVPGDDGDEYVEDLKAEIEDNFESHYAVLLFGRSLVVSPTEQSDKGVIYGGLIFDGDDWFDFALVPDQGLDGVVEQIDEPIINSDDPERLPGVAYDEAGQIARLLGEMAVSGGYRPGMFPVPKDGGAPRL